jgi:hypothetical protein
MSGAQVRVRFVDCDLNNPFLVEALIDDFKIAATVCVECYGDLDDNGLINMADLSALLANYNQIGGARYAEGDLDHDGDVDMNDMSALLAVYGTTCD